MAEIISGRIKTFRPPQHCNPDEIRQSIHDLVTSIRTDMVVDTPKIYAEYILEGLESAGYLGQVDLPTLANAASSDSLLWATYADLSTEMSTRLNVLITQALGDPMSFDIDKMKEQMGDIVHSLADHRLETIARTETLAAVNSGREMAWRITGDPEAKYIFLHPDDWRECPACAEVVRLVGDGKPMDDVKEIIRQVSMRRNGPKWIPRDWVVHPNCRGVLLYTEA